MPVPLRILLLQSPQNAVRLTQALQHNSIDFETARVDDLQTLEQALEHGPWDVLLVDHRLPHCSVEECLPRLRQRNQDIPCILVTENISKDRLSRLFGAGVSGHIGLDNLYLLVPIILHQLKLAADQRKQRTNIQALFRSEIRYRMLLDQSPVGTMIVCNGRLVYMNQKAKKMLDISAHTPIAEIAVETLFTAHAREPLMTPPAAGDDQAAAAPSVARFIRADGTTIQVEVWRSRTDYHGRPATQLMFHDVSERITLQTRLQQAAKVFEHITEGVMVTNENAEVIAVNPAFTRITGYMEKEVLGRNPRFLQSGRHHRMFFTQLWSTLKQQGAWRGEIWNRRKNGEIFPSWLTIVTVQEGAEDKPQYVAVFSDITGLIQSQTKLEHLAHHDPLTDLPNRLLFEDRLKHAITQAKREKKHLAVFFLDLDRFKNINDSLGHAVGDALLVQVARRLKQVLRANDTAARLGGDEFTILLENLEQTSHTAMIASKVLNQLKQPFDILGRKLHVTASIGISLYPDDGEDVGNLTKNADAAMYRAKEHGRNNYRFYTAELTQSALARLQLESELRTAIKEQQFLLYYQPQFSILSGKMTGTEALLRWRHPRLGVIAPARFIPLAEETGLIHEIGLWVFQTACVQTRNWSEKGLFAGRMALNLSVRQIMMTDLILHFEEIIEKTGCPPQKLQFEVTEGIFMRQKELSIPVLEVFKQLGLTIAIDDFGTGYSSLSYLQQLPIDKLKIDRSFIRDIPDNKDDVAITQAIISLGQNLGLEIIAEGVETEAQQDLLKIMGCQEVQGYLYGTPMPQQEFEKRLLDGYKHPHGSHRFSV